MCIHWFRETVADSEWCDVRQHLVRPCGLSTCAISHQNQIHYHLCLCVYHFRHWFVLKSLSVWRSVHQPHKKTHCRWPCLQQCENYLWRRCTEQGSETFLEENKKKKQDSLSSLSKVNKALHNGLPDELYYLFTCTHFN